MFSTTSNQMNCDACVLLFKVILQSFDYILRSDVAVPVGLMFRKLEGNKDVRQQNSFLFAIRTRAEAPFSHLKVDAYSPLEVVHLSFARRSHSLTSVSTSFFVDSLQCFVRFIAAKINLYSLRLRKTFFPLRPSMLNLAAASSLIRCASIDLTVVLIDRSPREVSSTTWKERTEHDTVNTNKT